MYQTPQERVLCDAHKYSTFPTEYLDRKESIATAGWVTRVPPDNDGQDLVPCFP